MPKKSTPKKKPQHFVDNYGPKLQRTRDQLAQFVDKWVEVLGLKEWDLGVNYDPGAPDTSPQCAGQASVDWKYKQCQVTFFLVNACNMERWELERLVIHELLHAVVNEMREVGENGSIKHEERVVTELTKAFTKLSRR